MKTFLRLCICALLIGVIGGCMARDAAAPIGGEAETDNDGAIPIAIITSTKEILPTVLPADSLAPTLTPEPTITNTPAPTPISIIEKWGMVDVRAYIPDIVVDMRYATENNFMQQAVYTSDMCLLTRGTADRLKAAQALFNRDGLSLKVYDAYRPRSAQQVLYDIAPDKSFVANPKNGSRHNRGAAVDVTLVDEAGEEVVMPSGYDDFTYHARRDYKGIDPQAKANAAYLTEVMVKCGFTTIANEWWHYDDKDYKKYPLTDYDPAEFYDF